MNRNAILKKIHEAARRDERDRGDARFLEVLGFFVAKGLLATNLKVTPLPNQKIRLEDALWAGRLEPRILEVLPAAVLRLPRHFDFDPHRFRDLARVLEPLKSGDAKGPDFHGIPYHKLKAWLDHPLKDGRVKPLRERRVPKTFRMRPAAIERLRELAAQRGTNETEALEAAIFDDEHKSKIKIL